MGRKLDLSGLRDDEAAHVLQVVQRDMNELKQELHEEGSRCRLLSRQRCFNQRCCIRCCSPFTFLLNPRRQCHDCRYNVCKACRVYSKRDKAWLCSACQKSRLLKTQSLEWFYTNVKKRFKRFGSVKVLKTLYRRHLAEHSALSQLAEGSAYEESVCNEGSVCGSDSTFYRLSRGHSMAEMLTVALQVAEEAIDEAISKAEFDTEKQNETHYLQQHRRELIEELAKTIVHKVRKAVFHGGQAGTDDSLCSHDCLLESVADVSKLLKIYLCLCSCVCMLAYGVVSSLQKSPDGNWITLQSTQLSHTGLLTRKKGLVYSTLERESGVVSAYEGLDSDESEPDSSWGAMLQEIHRKMMDSNLNLQDSRDRIQLSLMGCQGSRDHLFSDSERNWMSNKPLLAEFKRELPAEVRRTSSSCRTNIIDVNVNIEGAGEKEQTDSNEEDEEFDRRISSMLMMRLEDTQAETFKDENGRTSRELEDSGFREKVVDAQNTNSSEETGSANEFQSRGDKNVKDRPRERTEQSGEFSRKKESEDAMSRIENEQEERDTDSQERGNLAKEKSVVPTVEQNERYSAVSLCSITTEVLKVLNATEELLLGVEGGDRPQLSTTSLLPSSNPKKLDQQFSRLEENVYVAAGSVYSLEAELSDLEECARGICGATSDAELSFLEEQVASAAAMVQQSELQVGSVHFGLIQSYLWLRQFGFISTAELYKPSYLVLLESDLVVSQLSINMPPTKYTTSQKF
uniref:RabBD domain-containing protein n=1 Tax=Monopterus albus TaxID=43700 RepID=A0A3Q3K3U5_MONAL